MKKNNFLSVIISSALIFSFGGEKLAKAETNNPPEPLNPLTLDLGNEANSAITKLINNPTVWNSVISQFTNSGWTSSHSNAVLSLINELHLRPKVFQTEGSGESAGLGLEFDYNKSLQNKTFREDSINPVGLSLNVFAKGTIAESASKNPDNFLEGGFKLHLFQALGGMTPHIVTNKTELDLRDAARTAAASIEREDFWNDPAWLESGRVVMQYARPQFCYDIAANGGIEADQQFDNKQWVYGGQVALVYQDWGSDSLLNWLNVIDIPFAAIRWFTMDGEQFIPSGQAFPVVIGGLDLVDPSDNSARLAVDPEDGLYPRGRLEIGFKTQVTRVFETDIWLSASYKYFSELRPSSLIEAADMEDSSYFVARLDLPKGFNISYSTGKLPLDRESDSVYALGWAVNF